MYIKLQVGNFSGEEASGIVVCKHVWICMAESLTHSPTQIEEIDMELCVCDFGALSPTTLLLNNFIN